MLFDLTFSEAIAKAEHLKALGETTIYLRNEEGFPFDKVHDVETGGTYRNGIPTSYYLYAKQDGLTFKLSFNIEPLSENGRGTTSIDRDGLRDLLLKLPQQAQNALAFSLQGNVLPELEKRSAELRLALRRQADSTDCIRGIIAQAMEARSAETTGSVARRQRGSCAQNHSGADQ